MWATVATVPHIKIPEFKKPLNCFYDKSVNKYRIVGSKNNKNVYLGVCEKVSDAKSIIEQAIASGKIIKRGANTADVNSIHFARFIGYWLGDGWISKDGVVICGNRDDVEIIKDLLKNTDISGTLSIERTVARMRFGSIELSKWITENFGKGAGSKKIPTWLYGQRQEYIKAFLDGYFLADGYHEKNGCSFTTISKAIAIGVRILFNIIGISASICKHKNNRICTIEGRVINERPIYTIRSYIKPRSFKFAEGHGWGRVRKVEHTGKTRQVFNLSVEEDESYTADGIVVHNCQPFSVAGQGKAEKDDRHLWPYFRQLIKESNPQYVFGEQVASKLGREWLAGVQTDMEKMGFIFGAADIPACSVGAPHIRQRLWWVAHAEHAQRWQETAAGNNDNGLADTPGKRRHGTAGMPEQNRGGESETSCGLGYTESSKKQWLWKYKKKLRRSGKNRGPGHWNNYKWIDCRDGKWRRISPESEIFPLADGLSGRVALLRGIGNSIVPQVAAEFIKAFMDYDISE